MAKTMAQLEDLGLVVDSYGLQAVGMASNLMQLEAVGAQMPQVYGQESERKLQRLKLAG